jgi:mRNA interferase MazF
MGTPSVGDVFIIPFPYSDLSKSKRRPALVLAGVGLGDFLLCQVTSKQYDDAHALSLKESDFLSGGLQRVSFIRVGKLFTANEAIIVGLAGHIEPAKIAEAIALLVEMLSAGLQADTF